MFADFGGRKRLCIERCDENNPPGGGQCSAGHGIILPLGGTPGSGASFFRLDWGQAKGNEPE